MIFGGLEKTDGSVIFGFGAVGCIASIRIVLKLIMYWLWYLISRARFKVFD